jgi:hypothetical protein
MDLGDLIRIFAFALVFAAMALWEMLAPRRALAVGRRPRWVGNLAILAVDVLAVRILVPTAAVGAARSPPGADGDCFSSRGCGFRSPRCWASWCSIS